MFTATLFKRAQVWKQCKCPLKDEWIKKMCTQTLEYNSAIKKDTLPFMTRHMDIESTMLRELRERQILYDLTYMEPKNKFKTQNTTHNEQIGACQRLGEGDQKVETSSYKISHGNIMYNVVTTINNTVLYI